MRVAVFATLAPACEQHDIGKPCPQLLGDAEPALEGTTRLETEEVVAQDTNFPCEDLICIATDGRSGYCSRKCRSAAGCPDGFTCRTVQEIGPFAQDMFCAWAHCTSAGDCGSRDDFCCVVAPSPSEVDDVKLCDFKDGSCP
ncbi:MAG: hypothetical protein HYZ27_12015 [Deltaproteobacteria bacterium]|nr:hypothetical protein [Deltaproteobacteria bacterium]